jgi:hypothetical protein
MDNNQDEIEIVLKPLNISEIHKKEVRLQVNKYDKVGDFA